MTRLLAAGTTSLVLALAACGGDDDGESPADAGATQTTTQEAEAKQGGKAGDEEKGRSGAPGSVVEVGESQFGKILVDEDGRTLYAFDRERTDRSECFGACAEAWPPFLTKGEPRAGKGVEQRLLETTDYKGRSLVTYDGHPLYYFAGEGPNEVLCQGVDEFGGLWLVVDPGGDPIQ